MKTKKIILMCGAILLSAALTVQAQTEIRTAKDMAAIGKDKNSKKGSYILMNDLTLENWKPIDFFGVFNGNGHTITLTINSIEINKKMKAVSDIASFGLFRTINSGVVMNLHVTGNIYCEGNHFILSAGGIAGLNAGKIVNCISSVHLTGKGIDQPGTRLIVEATVGGAGAGGSHIMPFDGSASVGGIAGINKGIIDNCYATGDIKVSGNGHKYGGGIAGGNGNDFITRYAGASGVISCCYAIGAITLHDDDKSRIAGGIVGQNAGMLENSVALNNRIDVSGKSKSTIFNVCINSANGLLGNNYSDQFGKSQNGYYSAGMSINVELYDDEKAPKKVEPVGVAVDKITMQQQTWWENSPGFAFGQTNEKPWFWDETLQRPVLYWEKFEAAPLMSLSQTKGGKTYETSGQASLDISWRIENDTLIISGKGDIPGSPPWLRAMSNVSSVVIGDSITSLGHHAFANSKISTVVIGKNVTDIGIYVFFNSKEIKQMEVKNTIPPKVGSFVFMNTPVGKAKLIVPVGAKAAYAKNKDWKKFGVIEEQ